MEEYKSLSVEQTEDIAAEFATKLQKGDVIAYIGGLGAGKTAFTRGLARGLNLACDVSSPTFSLVHEYRNVEKNSLSLYHFDMYRITSLDDVYSTGYFDYLDLNEIIAIEWSENVAGILGDDTIYVELIKVGFDETDEGEVDAYNMRLIRISGGKRF